MSSDINRRLVMEVGRLLSQPAATHIDFFAEVSDHMRRRGYLLECHQRRQGTYICVVPKNVPQRETANGQRGT